MKMTGIVNYEVEDVFNHFMKNAKRDFKDFNEDNTIGCKIEKDINTDGSFSLQLYIYRDFLHGKHLEERLIIL